MNIEKEKAENIKNYIITRNKIREESNKRIAILIKSIGYVFSFICKGLFIAMLASLVGIQLSKIVYYINSPLGPGYALYASYFETSLITILLYMLILDKIEVKK